MKPNHEFTPARIIAQHCEELFSPEISAEERGTQQAEELTAFAARMCRTLQEQLAPQLGGDALKVTCEEVGKRKSASLFKAIGPSAANLAMDCGTGKVPVLLSFDFGAAQALTEQAFGGDVRGVESGLTELPRSAWMVLETIAANIVRGFAAASEIAGDVQLLRMHESVTKLDVFAKNAACLVWPISLDLSAEVKLPIRLAVAEADFLPVLEGNNASEAGKQDASDPKNQAAMFAQLPLPMRAVLADLTMPVSRLANLKPGDFIPFSPRPEVPLMMGSKTIARGRIGALNAEVALNVTRLS